MKIGLDGIFLEKLNCGTGQYSYQLIKGLNYVDSGNEYFIFSPFQSQLDFQLKPNFHWQKVKRLSFGKNLDKIFWEQIYLPLAARRENLDIFHSPYMALPYLKTARKTLVTVFDLIGLKFKEYREKLKWKIYYFLMSRLVKKRSDGLLTVSEFSKKDIEEILKITPEKIKVIYGSIESDGARPPIDLLKKKFNLMRKFILYVGRSDFRKNINNLIQAFEALNIFENYDLVIVSDLEIFEDKGGIKFLKNISRQHLSGFYKAAEVLVYPSFYEGFGLPVLEAMAAGCPVVASNISSIPEIAGGAALLVNPRNVDEIARAIAQVLSNTALRNDLIEKGREQAKKFDWLKMARETLEYYNSFFEQD